jgi:hypothetical protein
MRGRELAVVGQIARHRVDAQQVLSFAHCRGAARRSIRLHDVLTLVSQAVSFA